MEKYILIIIIRVLNFMLITINYANTRKNRKEFFLNIIYESNSRLKILIILTIFIIYDSDHYIVIG